MRMVRMMVIVLGMAGLAACGGSKEPAAVEDEASGNEAAETQAAGAATAGPPPSYAQCVSCHSVKPGLNGVGPSLHGVVGRKAASLAGYAYSEPLKASGLTWDAAALDKWLTAPMQDVPGTKMVFPGISDAARRKELIDYLGTLK